MQDTTIGRSISPEGSVPVRLNLIADKAEQLEARPEHIDKHRQPVAQAYRLFGSQHYDHYDFLMGLSDTLGRIGLEHHRSSENQVPPKYFTDWDKTFVGRDLLPHEFVHSWNASRERQAVWMRYWLRAIERILQRQNLAISLKTGSWRTVSVVQRPS